MKKEIVLEVGVKIPYSIGCLTITKMPCHICGNKTDYECERCNNYMCDNCQATYNQFSQIDYSCCEICASSDRYRD